MSKFSIIPSGGGTALYSGCPSFTGTYMKPGMLEFREVCSPTPIDWSVGDYVEYTRTGLTYRLYSTPQVKKQARSTEYGGAFVYQNVQLYDDSKQLDICPFRDLVKGDNRIHFSTQPSISTFEGVDGIAKRIQACLDDMYPGTWYVRLATTAMGASQDLVDLMAEAREFTVSGVSLLGALDKVYEVWPDVGWVFSHERVTIDGSSVWRNVLTIGGAGLSSTASYQYGKGNGLKSITRIVANSDEIATRIFAYGSSRNMLPRWYNSQTIKDADSVDIQNLMLPIDPVGTQGQAGYYPGWGKTLDDGTLKPDAAKAFLDASDAIMAKLGLRPKTYYFDGTGDLPEIYPTVREMTIKEVRDSKSSPSDPYYPSTTVYTDEDERVDTVLSAPTSFDSGLPGETSGVANLESDTLLISANNTFTQLAGLTYYPFYHYQGEWSPGSNGTLDISAVLNLDGYVQMDGIESVKVSISVRKPSYQGGEIIGREYELSPDTDNLVSLSGIELGAEKIRIENVTYTVLVELAVSNAAQLTDKTGTYSISGGITLALENYRKKTFKVGIRQIGFDIGEQANLGEGKTIAMRSGKCAGRSFVIKNCSYVSSTDSWELEIIRSNDESLSQWFPNTDYPISEDDEFVLLDIAMPDEYILVAERRLLKAAQELLADVSVERWQYTPEIDAKFMVENNRAILPAQNMVLSDANVVENTTVSILIDTVTINEGEAAIPTYKVTLRDRKKKTFTEAKGADSKSSNPVTNYSKESSNYGGDSYFTLDANGNVTLKPAYQNLWVPGWLAAGGVDDGGGGGGGGGLITSVKGIADLGTPIVTESLTETFSSKAIESIYEAVVALQQSTPNVSLTNGSTYSTLAVNGVSADFYTKAQVDSALANIDLSDYVTNTALATTLASYVTQSALTTTLADYATKAELAEVNTLVDITTQQDGKLKFEWLNEDEVIVDLNHEHSNYVTVTTTINGVDLSTNRMFYVGKTAIQGVSQSQALQGILSVKETSASSLFEWEASTGAWRFHGNLYADGWVAAGGVGSSGGGGGGVSSFYDLPEIGISSSSTILAGQVLTYNGTAWVNDNLGVSVSNTIPDGTTGYTRVATITINGVSVNINAPADGGGGGGGGTETDPIFSASAAFGITSNDITAWNGKLSGVMMNGSTITPTSGVVNLGTVLTAVPDLSGTYVTLTGVQTISGAKTFSSNLSLNAELLVNSISTVIQDTTNHSALFNYGGRTSQAFNAYGTVINLRAYNASEQANILSVQTDRITVGSQLIPNYQTGINLGGSSSNQRWSTIYGVNANLTGNLVMSSASYIDIGPVRIVYDSVSKAIHITKADSNDNNEYGLYCEGFIASGGVQATS